jgi:hypothetical protein
MSDLPFEYETFDEDDIGESYDSGFFGWWVSYNNFLDWSFVTTITLTVAVAFAVGAVLFGVAIVVAAFAFASKIAKALVDFVMAAPNAVHQFFVSLPQLLWSSWEFFGWLCLSGIPVGINFLLTNWLSVTITVVLLHFGSRLALSLWKFNMEQESAEGFIRGGSIEDGYASDDIYPDEDPFDPWADMGIESSAFPELSSKTGSTLNYIFESIRAFAQGFSAK